MEIVELISFSESDLRDLDGLMHQLSATSFCSEEKLRAVVEDENSHLYVIREDGRIVATATLCVSHTPEFTLGGVEAVVVSAEYRGQQLGRKLMERLITDAKGFGVQSVHLTSNPKRKAANGLYQALGFEKKETNCYTLNITL